MPLESSFSLGPMLPHTALLLVFDLGCVHVCVRTCVCVHACMCSSVSVHVCVRVRARVRARVCVHACVWRKLCLSPAHKAIQKKLPM